MNLLEHYNSDTVSSTTPSSSSCDYDKLLNLIKEKNEHIVKLEKRIKELERRLRLKNKLIRSNKKDLRVLNAINQLTKYKNVETINVQFKE